MNDTSTSIDVAALVRLLAATATEITALERQLRTTWTRPMAPEQRALVALRRRATMLCILRAHLRGKQHLCRRPRDLGAEQWQPARYHRTMAARAAERFQLLQATPS